MIPASRGDRVPRRRIPPPSNAATVCRKRTPPPSNAPPEVCRACQRFDRGNRSRPVSDSGNRSTVANAGTRASRGDRSTVATVGRKCTAPETRRKRPPLRPQSVPCPRPSEMRRALCKAFSTVCNAGKDSGDRGDLSGKASRAACQRATVGRANMERGQAGTRATVRPCRAGFAAPPPSASRGDRVPRPACQRFRRASRPPPSNAATVRPMSAGNGETNCAYYGHTFPRRLFQPWRGSTFRRPCRTCAAPRPASDDSANRGKHRTPERRATVRPWRPIRQAVRPVSGSTVGRASLSGDRPPPSNAGKDSGNRSQFGGNRSRRATVRPWRTSNAGSGQPFDRVPPVSLSGKPRRRIRHHRTPPERRATVRPRRKRPPVYPATSNAATVGRVPLPMIAATVCRLSAIPANIERGKDSGDRVPRPACVCKTRHNYAAFTLAPFTLAAPAPCLQCPRRLLV